MGPVKIQLDGDRLLKAIQSIQRHIEEETGEVVEEAAVGGIIFEILATDAVQLIEQSTLEPHYIWTRPDFQRLWRRSVRGIK